MSRLNQEDLNIVNATLDRLTEEIHDLSRFDCYFSESYDQAGEFDDNGQKSGTLTRVRKREYTIEFIVNKDRAVRIEFVPISGILTITIFDPNDFSWAETHDVEIGWYSDNKDIKIKFMMLFKKISNYKKIEIPRRKREKFLYKITEVFPDLLDHMILGEKDD